MILGQLTSSCEREKKQSSRKNSTGQHPKLTRGIRLNKPSGFLPKLEKSRGA